MRCRSTVFAAAIVGLLLLPQIGGLAYDETLGTEANPADSCAQLARAGDFWIKAPFAIRFHSRSGSDDRVLTTCKEDGFQLVSQFIDTARDDVSDAQFSARGVDTGWATEPDGTRNFPNDRVATLTIRMPGTSGAFGVATDVLYWATHADPHTNADFVPDLQVCFFEITDGLAGREYCSDSTVDRSTALFQPFRPLAGGTRYPFHPAAPPGGSASVAATSGEFIATVASFEGGLPSSQHPGRTNDGKNCWPTGRGTRFGSAGKFCETSTVPRPSSVEPRPEAGDGCVWVGLNEAGDEKTDRFCFRPHGRGKDELIRVGDAQANNDRGNGKDKGKDKDKDKDKDKNGDKDRDNDHDDEADVVYGFRIYARFFASEVNEKKKPTEPPQAATLVSPTGALVTVTPTFTWNAAPGAAYYLLWVNDAATGGRINQSYTAAGAGCGAGTGTCSVSPGVTLAIGAGRWWVQASTAPGTGPWSQPMTFTISQAQLGTASIEPLAATLVSPAGTIGTLTPTFTWNASAGATYYGLWVNDALQGGKVNQTYTAVAAGCEAGTGTCSVSPGVVLAAGAGRWWVQASTTPGAGPWSEPMAFTAGALPTVTLVSPSGALGTSTPTFTWNAVPGATSYELWVNDAAGGARIDQSYSAAAAGCGAGTGTCSVSPGVALATGAGAWWVQASSGSGPGPWSTRLDFTAP